MALLFLLACVRNPVAPAAVSIAPVPGLDVPLTLSPRVREGTFDNGMRWLVRKNDEPEDRVVFRLTVNTGSVMESDDQQGLAHLLEHMAFNGTTAFPGNTVIDYMEGFGAQFGPHINAHTSFEETVYKLAVPSDDPEALAKGFEVMNQWACCLTLDHAEIEAERGVVIEEWRTRRGVGQRGWDAFAPMLYRGTPYPARMPIGTLESLQAFEPEAVERYYADWYRPQNMAIIVVGDIDVEATIAELAKRFGTLPAKEASPPRPAVVMDLSPGLERVLFVDPEQTNTDLDFRTHRTHRQWRVQGDMREYLIGEIAETVLQERFAERARDPKTPWNAASAGVSPTAIGYTTDGLWVSPREGRTLDALEIALTEVERARRFGVLPGEFDRARKTEQTYYRDLLVEVETQESADLADELATHVLEKVAAPGSEKLAELAELFLPTIRIDEVNNWLKGYLDDGRRTLMVSMPKKDGLIPPTDAEIDAVFERVAASTIDPPKEEAPIDELVAAPTPGTITSVDDRYAALGFTGWTLSNGAKVWFKNTDFKEDYITFSSWAPGGHGAVPDADYRSAASLSSVVGLSGLGPHSEGALTRHLDGRYLEAAPFVVDDSSGYNGWSTKEEFDALLQLVHLQQTAPRFEQRALDLVQARWRDWVQNRLADPNALFGDAWNRVRSPDDPRFEPWNAAHITSLELPTIERTYRAALSDIGEQSFVFVGTLPADFETSVLTWIGGIPRGEAGLALVDRGFRPPKNRLKEVVKAGSADKAIYRTMFWGPMTEDTWQTRDALESTIDITQSLLRETLREELGGVYGVSARAWVQRYPDPFYRVQIDFTCDPGRVDELEAAMEGVLTQMRTVPVTEERVATEKTKNQKEHEEALRTDLFWSSTFLGALYREENPLDILGFQERNAKLTPAGVQAVANQVFRDAQRGTVVLLPAASEPE